MFIVSVIATEVVWYFFTNYSAKEEVAFTYPFRELEWNNKPKISREAHRSGAISIFLLILLITSLLTGSYSELFIWDSLIIATTTFLNFGAIYWCFFDFKYSVGIGQNKYFLGTTSKTDLKLHKYLGKNAGKKKAIFCLIFIIIYNILIFLL